MKINEVEKLIGITKKNIRFYEEQGLLSPSRNRENGYRDYSDNDIRKLEQIKFLRKLGLPIEEIRSMQSGKSTVADSIRRHLITLEREQQNLSYSMEFCSRLKTEEKLLNDLDVNELLCEMENIENSGAAFKDIHLQDVKPIRYVGAVIASAVMIVLMTILFLIMFWAFKTDPEEAPPLLLMIIFFSIPGVVSLGVIYALIQRIGEIKKGEIDDASRF